MTQTLSIPIFAAIAVAGISGSALACPSANHTIRALTLNSDGIVSRSFFVRKDVDGQNGEKKVKFVSVVRDQIKLESGDELHLNAAPSMVDATLFADISLKNQERDEKGIISSTYQVVEHAMGTFGGIQSKAVKTAYLVNVKGNYVGNGTYSRGCGEVTKTHLDLESSSEIPRSEN